jgi:hypothetical protein
LDKDDRDQEVEKFKKEFFDIQNQLSNLIKEKREQYDFPLDIDCNGEYYFVKIKQDPNCRS